MNRVLGNAYGGETVFASRTYLNGDEAIKRLETFTWCDHPSSFGVASRLTPAIRNRDGSYYDYNDGEVYTAQPGYYRLYL